MPPALFTEHLPPIGAYLPSGIQGISPQTLSQTHYHRAEPREGVTLPVPAPVCFIAVGIHIHVAYSNTMPSNTNDKKIPILVGPATPFMPAP